MRNSTSIFSSLTQNKFGTYINFIATVSGRLRMELQGVHPYVIRSNFELRSR